MSRPCCLTIATNAVVLWNTVYLNDAVEDLRREADVDDEVAAHLSPALVDHINPVGRSGGGGGDDGSCGQLTVDIEEEAEAEAPVGIARPPRLSRPTGAHLFTQTPVCPSEGHATTGGGTSRREKPLTSSKELASGFGLHLPFWEQVLARGCRAGGRHRRAPVPDRSRCPVHH